MKNKLIFLIFSLLSLFLVSGLSSCGNETSEESSLNSKLVIGMECGYQPFNWTTQKESEYTLYTPLLRKIKNESFNIYDVLIKILTNDDSIAYNLLLVGGYDIEKIYLDILSNKNIQDFG